jgi:hypothetical protein
MKFKKLLMCFCLFFKLFNSLYNTDENSENNIGMKNNPALTYKNIKAEEINVKNRLMAHFLPPCVACEQGQWA